MEKIRNNNVVEKESVEEVSKKMNLGTFCRLVNIEKKDGNRVYNMEDAYGNVKGFTEEQLKLQIKLGVLNAVNVEISKNDKIVSRKPSVLEIDYNNINNIHFFPCLVKVFDLTTEKEGTAVAVGYKKLDLEDKYKTIISVVINGNMYEASYKSIRSQGKTCRKNSCLNCRERNGGNCRFNRYVGGWKLCVKIHGNYEHVKYETSGYDDELLAVGVKNGSVVTYQTKKNWHKKWYNFENDDELQYKSKYKFRNASCWGGILEYDVPVIDWNTFNQNRLQRVEELEKIILEMCWQAVNEGTLELICEEDEVYPEFNHMETVKCFKAVWEEYNELNMEEEYFTEKIQDFLDEKCTQNNMKLYYIEEDEYRVIYAVDIAEGFRARNKLQERFKEEVEMFVNECEWTEEQVNSLLTTNIWDVNENEE